MRHLRLIFFGGLACLLVACLAAPSGEPAARGPVQALGEFGPVGTPARPASTRIKALARHEEFGDASNRLADAPRLVRRELAHPETVVLRIVAASMVTRRSSSRWRSSTVRRRVRIDKK